ncbi:MAG: GxxExxY protein [Nitrospirota bacterium]|nr:GxxExxY protein [Nitrospirota bacterium]
MTADSELLHRDLTKEIIESAFKVHNALGCGLLEKVYGNALVWDLELKKKKVGPQQEFSVMYRDKEVGVYYADLVVDEKVIVEVKSVDKIDDVHRAQLLNYLRISGLRVGLLINFARPKLECERFVV